MMLKQTTKVYTMFHPPLFIYFDSPPFYLMYIYIYILVYHTLIHPSYISYDFMDK